MTDTVTCDKCHSAVGAVYMGIIMDANRVLTTLDGAWCESCCDGAGFQIPNNLRYFGNKQPAFGPMTQPLSVSSTMVPRTAIREQQIQKFDQHQERRKILSSKVIPFDDLKAGDAMKVFMVDSETFQQLQSRVRNQLWRFTKDRVTIKYRTRVNYDEQYVTVYREK